GRHAKLIAFFARERKARPPARLAIISSSCWSCARAPSGNAQRTPASRATVIGRTNGARRNRENIAPRPAITGCVPRRNESLANRLALPLLRGTEPTNLTLSH